MRLVIAATLLMIAAPAFAHDYGYQRRDGGWHQQPSQWTCESHNGRGQHFYATESDGYDAAREAVQACLQATVLGDCEPAHCRADYSYSY